MEEHTNPPAPGLYIIATPIGNLDDFSPRAAKTLNSVDLIAAEDTRYAARLLGQIGIKGKRLISYHDHNEERRARQIIAEMTTYNLRVGLISDAGTPCISDPGFRLVRMAHENNIRVIAVPGPAAFITLICASGLPSDRFLFTGFLPQKKGPLAREIHSWAALDASVVFYESAQRIKKTINLIALVYPDCSIAFGRELTKIFEEIRVMKAGKAVEWLSSHRFLKGEFVIMFHRKKIRGLSSSEVSEVKLVIESALRENPHLSQKDLIERCNTPGLSKQVLYKIILKARKEVASK